MKRLGLFDGMIFTGAAMLVAGVGLFSLRWAVIVAGAALLSLGIFGAWSNR